MTSEITRRDFLNGIAISIVGATGVELCYVSGGAALHENVRAPLVYVDVVVRNWHPRRRLGGSTCGSNTASDGRACIR